MAYQKGNSPFLYDETTNRIIGLVQPDGTPSYLKTYSAPTAARTLSRRPGYCQLRAVSIPGFQTFDTRTFQQIWGVPFTGPCLARAVYETDDVAGTIITTTAIAAGRNLTDDVPFDPNTQPAPWTIFSNTAVAPASATYWGANAAGDGDAGIGRTGWARLDVPAPQFDNGKGGYIHVRTQSSATSRRCMMNTGSVEYQNAANAIMTSLRYRANYNTSGDNASTNQNSFVSATSASTFHPVSTLEVIPMAMCLSAAAFGDSTEAGYASGSSAIYYYSQGGIASNILNYSGLPPITWANYGMEGKGAAFYLKRLEVLLQDATWTPSFILIQPFTTNDVFTTNAINAGIAKALELAAKAQARGIPVIWRTVTPSVFADLTQDNARKAGNAQIRLAGANVLDASAIIGDGASPERIRTFLDTDGLHISKIGKELIGNRLAELIKCLPIFMN